MILLTGATGTVGTPLLRRLTAAGTPVRCFVRDPRRLGAERVRVQLSMGDLADPHAVRNVMRWVKTVVHLAASMRDQPSGSIEELTGVATWRMVRAAEKAGVEHFVFFSALGASTRSPARFLRAKALAEQAVATAGMRTTVIAPSLVYSPDDTWLRLLERASILPLVPLPGPARAPYQPIWADDVADCVAAALNAENGGRARYELAGPDTLSVEAVVALALRSFRRRRPLVHVPRPVVQRGLRVAEALAGPTVPVTWDEAELADQPMTSVRGTADAERLGVQPAPMRAVLGAP